MIRFRLDPRSGLPVYRQLVQQVRQAVQLEVLRPGDQLPTVREVVRQVAINPNTVHRAYRELEHLGLIEGRQGQGTFVARNVRGVPAADLASLRAGMDAWVAAARAAGLDEQGMQAVLAESIRKAAGTGRDDDGST